MTGPMPLWSLDLTGLVVFGITLAIAVLMFCAYLVYQVVVLNRRVSRIMDELGIEESPEEEVAYRHA